jgi:hypothetical protein
MSEVLVSAPALSTTIAPDTRTMTYRIQHDTDSAFGTAATLVDNLIVQTGAGGVGAAAATAPLQAAHKRQTLHPPANRQRCEHDRCVGSQRDDAAFDVNRCPSRQLSASLAGRPPPPAA